MKQTSIKAYQVLNIMDSVFDSFKYSCKGLNLDTLNTVYTETFASDVRYIGVLNALVENGDLTNEEIQKHFGEIFEHYPSAIEFDWHVIEDSDSVIPVRIKF